MAKTKWPPFSGGKMNSGRERSLFRWYDQQPEGQNLKRSPPSCHSSSSVSSLLQCALVTVVITHNWTQLPVSKFKFISCHSVLKWRPQNGTVWEANLSTWGPFGIITFITVSDKRSQADILSIPYTLALLTTEQARATSVASSTQERYRCPGSLGPKSI